MLRRPLLVFAAAAALMLLSLPAQAASSGTPITCGMVVTGTADLYLAKDLYCPRTDGVTVQNPENPDDAFTVHVDLRGHTLRGTRAHQGVNGVQAYPDYTTLTTTNGRVEGWGTGVGAANLVTTHVKLVGNARGLVCLDVCRVAESYLNRNDDIGLYVGPEASARVTTTTFSRNEVAAYPATFGSVLTATRSVFARNTVGVQLWFSTYRSDLNSYRGNEVAIRIRPSDGLANLSSTRDLYVDNGADVVRDPDDGPG